MNEILLRHTNIPYTRAQMRVTDRYLVRVRLRNKIPHTILQRLENTPTRVGFVKGPPCIRILN